MRKRPRELTAAGLRDLEAALKAAADPTRLRILSLLAPGPLCVCQIAAVLGTSQPATSRHLALLRRAALIDAHRRGQWVWYQRPSVPRSSARGALLTPSTSNTSCAVVRPRSSAGTNRLIWVSLV